MKMGRKICPMCKSGYLDKTTIQNDMTFGGVDVTCKCMDCKHVFNLNNGLDDPEIKEEKDD